MPIKLSIDVKKIIKDHLYQGKKGLYLNLVLWPSEDDPYGNDWVVKQDIPQEARQAGEKAPILGNGKNFGDQRPTGQQKPRGAAPTRKAPTADAEMDAPEDDDIPF